MFLNTDQAPLLTNQQVDIFTDGTAKFRQLFADIDAAKRYVMVEYYTIYNDALGNELRQHLIAKLKPGSLCTCCMTPGGRWARQQSGGGHWWPRGAMRKHISVRGIYSWISA